MHIKLAVGPMMAGYVDIAIQCDDSAVGRFSGTCKQALALRDIVVRGARGRGHYAEVDGFAALEEATPDV